MSSDTLAFSELAPEDLRLICNYGVIKNYPKHSILINEGDRSDALYIILSGRVKVYASEAGGKEVLLTIMGAGEFFGELALIDEAPRSASVSTLEACSLGVVARSGFLRCIAEHPELALKLIRALSRRFRALTEQFKNLALLDVYGRVARLLESLSVDRNGQRVVEQRLTHQDIANMVGASREMVSRIMRELTIGDYIQVKNKQIRLQRKLPANW